jgi:hypothetical protein
MHAGGWPSTVNWHEVLIGASVAAIWITPVLLIWFDICSKMPFNSMTKLVLDQLCFSPFFTASIVSLRTLLSGKVPYAELPAHLLVLVPKAGKQSSHVMTITLSSSHSCRHPNPTQPVTLFHCFAFGGTVTNSWMFWIPARGATLVSSPLLDYVGMFMHR